ncbi:hypothetical protein [Manganibacter manganicus]|uniref:Uncharacterized protein n=1 Tax=Manganibacter manganicus TaxID=1873176 RepID=A0A1V8RML2_9HYPH|nr:hypothetical protein [Pseudaminobacter manganicus]OQM74353.1 hypothetical protein BFN67_05810 [Pseudaminobacter manganicus]
MVSERSALLALANLLRGLIVKLQENEALKPEEARALIEDTLLKSAGEPPKTRGEIREFLHAMFPSEKFE